MSYLHNVDTKIKKNLLTYQRLRRSDHWVKKIRSNFGYPNHLTERWARTQHQRLNDINRGKGSTLVVLQVGFAHSSSLSFYFVGNFRPAMNVAEKKNTQKKKNSYEWGEITPRSRVKSPQLRPFLGIIKLHLQLQIPSKDKAGNT